MDTATFWKWQVKQANGRWRLLNWRMTVEMAATWAAGEARELRQVPGSDEVRRPEVRSGGLMDRLGTAS